MRPPADLYLNLLVKDGSFYKSQIDPIEIRHKTISILKLYNILFNIMF